MIGLASAVALLGMSVWILADWWFAPRQPRFRVRIASSLWARLRTMLIEAELEDWHARYVVLASLGLALVCGTTVYQALGWLIPGAVATVAGASAPVLYVWHRRAERRTTRQEQLADALERARDELQTGSGLQQALAVLGSNGPSALQPIFRRLAQDLDRYHDFEYALLQSRRRMADPVWDACSASLLLSHASGGAIGQTLEDLAASARAEVQLRRAIRSRQASGETAARITLLIPFIVVVFLRVFSPGAADFYSSPFGEVLLMGAFASFAFGYGLMRRVSSVPSTPRTVEPQT